MQYDYRTGGLQVDIAGLVTAKAKKDQIDAERKRAEQLAERDRKYQETYSKYRQSKDPKALRDLMGLDAERTKQIMDMDAEFNDTEQQSMADTIQEAKFYADNGDISDARLLFKDRLATLSEFGSSTGMTAPLARAATEMDDLDFLKVLDQSYNVGVGKGLIVEPPAEELEYIRSAFDDRGREYAMLMRPDGSILQRYTGDTRTSQEQAKQGTGDSVLDLSQPLGKRAGELMAKADSLQSRASQAGRVYDQFDALMKEGIPQQRDGVIGKLYDFGLGIVGEEDPLTFLRTDATNLVNTEVVASLPPGVASDKDIALMKKGAPDPYSNPEEFKKWLATYRRISEAAALSANINAEFIEVTGGGRVSKLNTNLRGVPIRRGERIDEFKEKLFKKQEKDRREREKAQKQFSNQEAQLGQALGVNNVPKPTNNQTKPAGMSQADWEELLELRRTVGGVN